MSGGVRDPLETNYEGNQEEKGKIDEAQYAFRIFKIIFFHRQGCIGAVLPAYFGDGNGNSLSLSPCLL